MAYQNDPNRIDPDRPGRPPFQYMPQDGGGWIPMILAVAAVALLIMLLLPSRNETGPRVTENAPRTEQPSKPVTPSAPPANKPTPTPPAPTQPQ